jgi:prolipoprotein diacylglyceryltransferase
VRLDPFRIQILTLSLDSQVVLLILGLFVAGLVVRQAARQAEINLGAGHWWDLVFTAVVGGRLVWVVAHADYYLRQPLQIVVILDGGVHATGLVLGAAYGTWRLASGDTTVPWRRVADLLALGVLTTFLFGYCTSTPPEQPGRGMSRGSVNLLARWTARRWIG